MNTTLNKDILLIPSKYGKYDLSFNKIDIDVVSGLDSYYNAVKMAILTGFNELTKTGNMTYVDFGCKAHDSIKKNKTNNMEYEIETYVAQTVSDMRRTQSVESVEVTEKMNGYDVTIHAISIDDTEVEMTVELSNKETKTNTALYAKTELAYCNQNIPLRVDISLKNYENNTSINDIVYIYVNDVYVQTFTLKDSVSTFKYIPNRVNHDNSMKILYKGNENYNASEATIHFISE